MTVKYCSQCGDPLEPGQKFCEKCGAKVEDFQQSPQGSNVSSHPQPSISGVGGLFDPSRKYYVLQEKYWDWGSGPIMDEKGQEIGKMHRKILSLRAKIEFLELDGTISAAIHKKLVAIKPTYDLKDQNDQMIARLRKTFWSFIHPKFYLENLQGQNIMTAQGKFMGWDFTVYDNAGKLIGTINKTDRWRDVFLGGIFDFKDTYALKIEDPSVDRRLLLGFVIAIDNTLHDNRGNRGGFGLGIRI